MFALRFLKQCTANVIHYDLIGPVYDEAYWQECQSVVRELPSNIVVNYRGSIHSEMIPSELQSYDVMLLPTTGENFGHTILESFMAGCPVIISDRTPWKQLEKAMAGREIPLEEPERFVSAVNEFAAMEPAVFEQWSKSAFAFALQYLADSEMLAENVELFSLQA
jgi:glycosyltransferase involved in cell wall biosynthesis